jgi:hypothetical protein
MTSSLSRPVALIFLLVFALPAAVLAQSKDTADVHGVVHDASGQPAAGYPMKLMTPLSARSSSSRPKMTGPSASRACRRELRASVFEPGGTTDTPIASKQVTLAAGQAEKIEIRVGSAKPAAATLGTTGVNWTIVQRGGLVLLAGLIAFIVLRARERARS